MGPTLGGARRTTVRTKLMELPTPQETMCTLFLFYLFSPLVVFIPLWLTHMTQYSVATVDMDKKTLSFAVNGKDLGVCHTGLPDEVCPAVTLYKKGDKVTLKGY